MLADGQTKVMAPSAALATAPPREAPNVSRDRPLVNETRGDEVNEMVSFKGGDKADGATAKANAAAMAPSGTPLNAEGGTAVRNSGACGRRVVEAPGRPARASASGLRDKRCSSGRPRSEPPAPIDQAKAATPRQRPRPIPPRRRPQRRRQALSPATSPRRRPLCRQNPASARPRRSKRDWPIWSRR